MALSETDITGKLMAQCRQDLHGSLVLKHADRSTSGIPDFTVSWAGPTFWVENKYIRKGKRLKDVVDTEQLILCHEIARSTAGRCWVTVYEQVPCRLTIWQPRVLMAELFPKMILQDHDIERPVTTDERTTANLFNVINTIGGIRCNGWTHSFLTRLIRDAA